MAQRVGIVGVTQTNYESAKDNVDNSELAFEVVESLLQDTGVKYVDQTDNGFGIDRILNTTEDLWVGQTGATIWMHKHLGGWLLSQTNVCADGAQAVYHAVLDVLSGRYQCVLVVPVCKESDALKAEVIETATFDPLFLRPLGLDYVSAAALQARRYMYKYGISREQCAKVVVRNRRNAMNNPFAQEPLELTIEDVLNSKTLASPMKVLDCRPQVSDGACALIVTDEEHAKMLTDKPVWITGIGNCYDSHGLGDRDLADCDSLQLAAKRAYSMAGVADPLKEIDVAEISTEYSYQEMLWLEGLGFCDRGEGGTLIDNGVIDMDGPLPVNPSGGILAGNPMQVAGGTRTAEAVLQLRGEAGARQVKDAKTALVHGTYGPCGQTHCVLILST